MRNFAAIPPSIWQTDLKKLRGDVEAIAVHYHLTTNSHSTMIGIYHLPVMYLAYEIGLTIEGASKGLQRVCQEGIATYDEESEIVWVREMAASQVAPRLTPKDNKVVSVAKQLAALPICQITLSFYERYRDVFHLRDQKILDEFERAFLGASDPLRSKDKEKEKEKDLGEGQGTSGSGVKEDTYPHARERDEQEFPYDPPSSPAESKAFLMRLGLPQQFMEAAMQRHIRGKLFPCDVEEWKREERGAA